MTADQRFFEYARAFEETYADDDWTRLEPFFAENAVYEVRNSPAACTIRGRDAILRALKKSIDGFDRRFGSRAVELTAPPTTDGNTVRVRWSATYEWPGAPALRFEGASVATVDGGVIVHLADEYPDGGGEATAAWIAAYAPDLDPSYV